MVSFSVGSHQSHLRGRKHLSIMRGTSISYRCPTCDRTIPGANWATHLRGRKHKRNAAAKGSAIEVEPEELTSMPGHQYCTVCKTLVLDRLWDRHPASVLHRRRLGFAKFEAAFDEAGKDKHGITVSHLSGGLDFGVIEVAAAQTGVSLVLTVTNSVPLSKVTLVEVKVVVSSLQKTTPFVSRSSKILDCSLIRLQIRRPRNEYPL